MLGVIVMVDPDPRINSTDPVEPILKLIDAVVEYRRAQERYSRAPIEPRYWNEICRYLDIILLTGTDQMLRERFKEKKFS